MLPVLEWRRTRRGEADGPLRNCPGEMPSRWGSIAEGQLRLPRRRGRCRPAPGRQKLTLRCPQSTALHSRRTAEGPRVCRSERDRLRREGDFSPSTVTWPPRLVNQTLGTFAGRLIAPRPLPIILPFILATRRAKQADLKAGTSATRGQIDRCCLAPETCRARWAFRGNSASRIRPSPCCVAGNT